MIVPEDFRLRADLNHKRPTGPLPDVLPASVKDSVWDINVGRGEDDRLDTYHVRDTKHLYRLALVA